MTSIFKIDFIGIGAPRCATTWIYYCLKEHPQICMSEPKETYFFLRKDIGIKPYSSYFKHCKGEKIKGEFTPMYVYHPEVIEKIKAHNPEVKLICSLRNPIERVYSDYLQSYPPSIRNKYPLGKVVREIKSIINGSLYYSFLSQYYKEFPRNNIFIIIYEDIVKDPLQVCQKLFKFLDVEENFVPFSLHKKYLESKKEDLRDRTLQAKAAMIRHFFQKRQSSPVFRVIYEFLSQSGLGVYILRKINRLSQKPSRKCHLDNRPELTQEVRNYLRGIFRKDIEKLEKLINRDLSSWY
ncbi:sulfotransferase [bacterium]|nr:sulfotransferase [bacterium]